MARFIPPPLVVPLPPPINRSFGRRDRLLVDFGIDVDVLDVVFKPPDEFVIAVGRIGI